MARKIVGSERITHGSVTRHGIVLPNLPKRGKAQNAKAEKPKQQVLNDLKGSKVIIAGEPAVARRWTDVGDKVVFHISKGKTFTLTKAEMVKIMGLPITIGSKGFLHFKESDSPVRGITGKSLYAISVLTPLEARGKGHGMAMFERLEEEAKKMGIRLIWGRLLKEDFQLLTRLQRIGWRQVNPRTLKRWVALKEFQTIMMKEI